jgi:hypothetical protein
VILQFCICDVLSIILVMLVNSKQILSRMENNTVFVFSWDCFLFYQERYLICSSNYPDIFYTKLSFSIDQKTSLSFLDLIPSC